MLNKLKNIFNDKKIVVRFAPSPTGLLHLGNYRTAVFAYLYARKNGGKFILRIEDTDRERSKKEYEENIIESLKWLNIDYDNFYRQSENLTSHTKHLKKLIEEGKAFISKEEAKDGSGIMRELVRFKNPNKDVIFNDIIRGEIKTNTTDLGDFVIAKSITEPLFHLAVVVDDYEEGVTHILRGEDHIPNTPRQILIQEALGFPHPTYAHLPLVLSEDRTKLSKRKGALPVTAYRDIGYLPEALINFMAFIGWNPGGEKEIFSKEELVKIFDLSDIQKGGAIFNEEKLKWMNKEHLKKESKDKQFSNIKKFLSEYDDGIIKRAQDTIIERISYYGEIDLIKENEFEFLIKRPKITGDKLVWKTSNKEKTIANLIGVLDVLSKTSLESIDSIKNNLMPYAEKNGKGDVLWPLRFALSGQDKSMDPFTICYILQSVEAKERIENAIKLLNQTTM